MSELEEPVALHKSDIINIRLTSIVRSMNVAKLLAQFISKLMSCQQETFSLVIERNNFQTEDRDLSTIQDLEFRYLLHSK